MAHQLSFSKGRKVIVTSSAWCVLLVLIGVFNAVLALPGCVLACDVGLKWMMDFWLLIRCAFYLFSPAFGTWTIIFLLEYDCRVAKVLF